jgi:hypothetical protein
MRTKQVACGILPLRIYSLTPFRFHVSGVFRGGPPENHAAPAEENSRQLAQFAANRGPAPARSRFQPFSFCARSLLSAFCFPSFCFSPGPPRRAQDQFQSPVRPEECDARRLGVEEFIKTGMSRPGLLRLLSGDKGIQTLGNSQGMTARPCRR